MTSYKFANEFPNRESAIRDAENAIADLAHKLDTAGYDVTVSAAHDEYSRIWNLCIDGGRIQAFATTAHGWRGDSIPCVELAGKRKDSRGYIRQQWRRYQRHKKGDYAWGLMTSMAVKMAKTTKALEQDGETNENVKKRPPVIAVELCQRAGIELNERGSGKLTDGENSLHVRVTVLKSKITIETTDTRLFDAVLRAYKRTN